MLVKSILEYLIKILDLRSCTVSVVFHSTVNVSPVGNKQAKRRVSPLLLLEELFVDSVSSSADHGSVKKNSCKAALDSSEELFFSDKIKLQIRTNNFRTYLVAAALNSKDSGEEIMSNEFPINEVISC